MDNKDTTQKRISDLASEHVVKAVQDAPDDANRSNDDYSIVGNIKWLQPAVRRPLATEAPPANERYGLYIVTGSAQSGKSARIAALHSIAISQGLTCDRLVASESDWQSVGDSATALSLAIFGESDLILIDSIKDVIYMGKGSLGSGGVNKTVISELSTISAELIKRRKLCVAIINPIDDNVADEIFKSFVGTVAGVIQFGDFDYDSAKKSSICSFLDYGHVKGEERMWSGRAYLRPSVTLSRLASGLGIDTTRNFPNNDDYSDVVDQGVAFDTVIDNEEITDLTLYKERIQSDMRNLSYGK